MAENEGVGVRSNAETKENGPESPPIACNSPQNGPTSSPGINNNTGSSQRLSASNSVLSGASNGLTSEQRRKLINEAEQQRTEHRRLQLLESQRRAEEQREKLREERKRRIEETKKREEARQKKALETKKELERQYKDHLMMSQRGLSTANSNQSRQMPSAMRASHMFTTRSHTAGPSSSANGDRMATSFTVAFGSSAPRSICTKANEAVLRSQVAFEARLASYLNGRHSGCFLTKSSTYTTYALYVKPDLLPEDHPIRRHHIENHQHNASTPRRAISANPALRTTQKSGSSSGVVGDKSRAVSATRHPSQQQCRSRFTIRLPMPASGAPEFAQLAPIRRAVSSQHFAEPTIAYSGKVRGAPPPDILRKASGDGTMPKRRIVPGRSTLPHAHLIPMARIQDGLCDTVVVKSPVQHLMKPPKPKTAGDRCYSYAAPTTAWTNRQRANSQDRKPIAPVNEDRMTTSVMNLLRRRRAATEVGGDGGEARSRSKLREQPPTTSQKTQLSVNPSVTKTASLKPATAKKNVKPLTNESVKANATEASVVLMKQVKSVQSSSPSKSASPSAASPTVEPELTQSPSPSPSVSNAAEPQDAKLEPSPFVHLPPQPSLAAELDLAAASPPPPPETPAPEPALESAGEEVEESPEGPFTSVEVLEATANENAEVVEERTVSENEQVEEMAISEPKTEEAQEPEAENGHEEGVQRHDSLEDVKDAIENETMGNEEPEPSAVQQQMEEANQKLAAQLPSGPLKASTTGSGEGGCLSEEEAAIYRAKMAEQRRLAKERLAEQQRREAEAEKERRERREAERQAAIEAARERAIEEARLAAEARMAREAAEEEARLQAERKAQERADKERQASLDWSKLMVELTDSDMDRLEAMMRERSERIRKSEEEREMRRKRLESIMSRVNRSDRSLSRGVPTSGSANGLTGSATAASGNATDEETGASASAVHFSLGPADMESSNVFQTANGESGPVQGFRSQQNGFSELPRTTFNSPLLTSLFSGGGLGTNSRLTGAANSASAMATSDNTVSTCNENMHSEEAQQPPPTTNLPLGTVANASNG